MGLRLERLEARLMMAADWGDAPAPYPVTLAENGARHETIGAQLGAARDMEADGAHTADAAGDGADDDGVLLGPLRAGQLGAVATVTVDVQIGDARLDAWIDFDGDGTWGGAGEQIADKLTVTDGSNIVRFDVPSWAKVGGTFARFRVSGAGGLSPEGAAPDGEVEDYAVTIVAPSSGSGEFSGASTIATGATAVQSVIAVDLDRDGRMDVISAAYGSDTVTWHRQTVGGVFTPVTVTTAADGARGMAVADFDNDGDLDVATASQLDDEIAWHSNNGNLTFTTTSLTTTATNANAIRAADLDGDGDMDIVAVANTRVQWFENNGAGVFTARLLTANGATLTDLAVVDLDSDGDLDIVCARNAASGAGVFWYRNNGSQTFTIQSFPVPAGTFGPKGLAAADIDRDGDMDIAVAAGANLIGWYDNNGSETFTFRTITTNVSGAESVYVADIDGDGDFDVASASATDNKLAWYQNDGSQNFSEVAISGAAASPRSVVMADIDGDGVLDAVAAQAGNARVAWYKQAALTPGDYDDDGVVAGGDFLLWQRTYGAPATPSGSGADGSKNGTVDDADLAFWAARFGSASAAAAAPAQAALVVESDAATVSSDLAALDALFAEWSGVGRSVRRRGAFIGR